MTFLSIDFIIGDIVISSVVMVNTIVYTVVYVIVYTIVYTIAYVIVNIIVHIIDCIIAHKIILIVIENGWVSFWEMAVVVLFRGYALRKYS